MAYKKWNLAKYDKKDAEFLADEYNFDPVTAILLASRGITQEDKIRALFNTSNELIDPYLLPDMDIAVERIGIALDSGEKIAVFGDFDADGVTSTALLYLYLKSAGAEVIYYIPDRNTEGYGLNCGAIDKFSSDGISLIITVDNGISAFREVAYANEKNIDVVITDHHMQNDALPEAVAIVNPHRTDSECEYTDWAGVGVTFKLVCALDGNEEEMLNLYSDLVAIGTVADIVSTLGENRILINEGLKSINNTGRIGIAALKGVAGVTDKTLTSGDIAFVLSPRLNAAGRMGSAMRAVKLLISDDTDEAISLAEDINASNAERIEVENKIFAQAESLLSENEEMNLSRVLVICSKGWNNGVSGIVASKIVEKYGKPCIIIADNGNDEVLKGSCRSLNGFSIFDALVATESMLEQFGGHTLAAGLSVKRKNVDEFRVAINDYAGRMFHYMPCSELNIDFKINPASINLDTLAAINLFQPFGMNNSKPLFGLYKMQLINISPMSGNKHIKLTLAKNGATVYALYFNHSTYDIPYEKGDIINCAVSLEKNEYYGKVSVSIFVKDIKISGADDDELIFGRQTFENFKRGELLGDEIMKIAVDRDNIAQIYIFLKNNNGWGFSYESLYMKLLPRRMNFSQMLLSLEVMKELGLVIESKGRIDLPIEAQRVNIPDSPSFQQMVELLEKR